MRRALVKRVVTLLLLLTMVVPYCFVTYNDVYGDSKQNLSDANNKKSDLQSEYDKTQKKLDELKSQSDDVETYLAQLDSQMSTVNRSLNEEAAYYEQSPDAKEEGKNKYQNLYSGKKKKTKTEDTETHTGINRVNIDLKI